MKEDREESREEKVDRLLGTYWGFITLLVLIICIYLQPLLNTIRESLIWLSISYKEIISDKFFIAFITGYIVVGIIADILLSEYALSAWARVRKSSKDAELNTNFAGTWRGKFSWMPRRIGIIERVFYTTAVILGQFTFIGVWLIFKAIGQWKDISENDKSLKKKNEGKITRIRANMFLIGTGLSLIFGLLGGVVFKAIVDNSYLLNLISFRIK